MQLASLEPRLRELGVAALAVINAQPERARLYFQYRPLRIPLLVDPEATVHRAFGLPRVEAALEPRAEQAVSSVARTAGFDATDLDEEILGLRGTQLAGHFLLDRQGIVRWARAESADSPEEISRFPGEGELLCAVRTLAPQGRDATSGP